MTVLGYFNSLRELGGARRILEEEVQNTIKAYGGAQARRRGARALPGPQELLRGGGADLARAHGQGGRGAPAPGGRLPRHQAARRLRHRDQHDLGGPRHPAARADGRARPAQDARRVHPGHEPRRPRRRAARARGDAPQHPQAARPLALRALPALPRDLLPLGRGGERHALLGARARPRLRRGAGGPGAARRARADAAAGRRADRGRPGGARAPAPRRLPRARPPAAVRGRGGARGTPAQRAEPGRGPARLLAEDLRRLPRCRGRAAVPEVRAEAAQAAASRDAGPGLRVRAPPEVPGQPLAPRRRARGEPVPEGPERHRRWRIAHEPQGARADPPRPGHHDLRARRADRPAAGIRRSSAASTPGRRRATSRRSSSPGSRASSRS